jgi:hypothetical protein
MLEIEGQDSANALSVRAAVRGLVPRQGSLPPLLANLSLLAGHAGSDAAKSPWPPALTAAARQWIASMPHAARLGFADALRAALDNSGLFLEARLAQAARNGTYPAIQQDLKGGLLRLLHMLGSIPATDASASHDTASSAHEASQYPPLRHSPLRAQARVPASLEAVPDGPGAASHLKGQVDGALARLELMQLSAHPSDGGGACWLIEMPVRQDRGIDLWQLRVEREPTDGSDGRQTPAWTATLSFDLNGLGPVHARVTVRGAKVSTLFRARRAATADLYSRALEKLAALYQAHGLGVGALACHVGEPHSAPPQSSGLLDLQA